MKRSGLSILRRSVGRSFFSTSQKATPSGSIGFPTTGSFEHTTPIPQSEKTKSLLEMEEKTLAKVSYEIEEGMLNTNQLPIYCLLYIIK